MSRSTYLALALGMAAVLPLARTLSSTWLARVAPRFVTIPNRDYWLAPERIEATLPRLAAFNAATGMLAAGFVTALHLLIVDAHRSSPPRLSVTWGVIVLAVFGCGIVALLAAQKRSFPTPR